MNVFHSRCCVLPPLKLSLEMQRSDDVFASSDLALTIERCDQSLSYEGLAVDALALASDEGRGWLR